jgi:anti-sigma regulatory factor (Ser/Thr protein kinase)
MNGDEQDRLAALRAYRILDTAPDRAFDDLVRLASQICGTPIALITLIDAERQWFKSRIGVSIQETSRDIAFCTHAIRQRDLFIVPDALQDERFRNNPFVVADPKIRFYTGAPLITAEGHALGTLCVIDRKPRILDADQLGALDALRRQVVAQLELRRNLHELEHALAQRDLAEQERERVIEELREALDGLKKLSGLMPLSTACRLNLVIPADTSAIPKVADGVMQIVDQKHFALGRRVEIEIALREALANAIKHGCKNDPTKSVQCCVALEEDGELLIVVRDPGPGFDVSTIPNPLEGSGLTKASGRGVFLINQFMDEVQYEDEGREVRMRMLGSRSEGELGGEA